MTFQSSIKVLLVSAAAVCCVCPANAQMVYLEASGTVDSFHGGFGRNSDLGQWVTFDFSYNSGLLTQLLTPADFLISSPLTSASILCGSYWSRIGCEPNGSGLGFIF